MSCQNLVNWPETLIEMLAIWDPGSGGDHLYLCVLNVYILHFIYREKEGERMCVGIH